MEHGVDVYAAEDGVVSWSFDGKFDRCPAPAEPDCREPSGPLAPGRRDGTTVCTPLGPFCRDGRGECFWCFAGGNVVVVLHERPDVFATRYDHFKKGSILVKPGEKVKKGQKLGEVGSAGRSTAPHLHFEVWGKTFYDPVDPWLGPCSPARGRSLWNRQPKPY
ncbi:MAG: M23 family metallopeptidase [Elusimicrobia bacterium]|nr:M23 family metallopeptidase [Elusimicrobiota bacterium]